MLMLNIHHIGYLVKKMDAAILTFKNLEYRVIQDTIYDDIRKVDICFLEKDGYCIELVSPVSEDSVVAGLLKKYKNCPYHICYETTDFEKDFEALRSEGFMPIDTLTPAPALSDKEVVFMTHAALGMIELIKSD
ncbi:MAG: VOC family protein [Lachnospiraceae bacterium]|nr:VOC family protein [Lachnospiraceae bacterium]